MNPVKSLSIGMRFLIAEENFGCVRRWSTTTEGG